MPLYCLEMVNLRDIYTLFHQVSFPPPLYPQPPKTDSKSTLSGVVELSI